jgi:hypothetical protein
MYMKRTSLLARSLAGSLAGSLAPRSLAGSLAPRSLAGAPLRVASTLVAVALFAGCQSAAVKLEDTSGNLDLDSTDSSDSTDSGDTGVIVSGDISVSPSSIDIPVLFIGQSATADVTVKNIGDGPVSVTMSFAGAWATSYTLSSYTADPAPGAESLHTLTLTPTTWGDHSVGLIIDADTGAHIEVPVRALVQEDADGDGVGSVISGGEDCDDTNADIQPGASDTWYDGIDSDCSGNDDYDQDGDGAQSVDFGGDDCDDTNADINPAASDTWYDGVDSDCAGNDDYDQDYDGYVPDEYAGLPTTGDALSGGLPDGDCDDTDANINPAATDTWYDGIDNDCAGNDDYDKDGDGHQSDLYGGDDCNDTNSSIYGGAPDAWYDGVDSDCAGNDDYDQDGDGYDSSLYGGDDCNDTDATVTGPVAETFNGIDDDCDGYVDDFAVGDLASGAIYGYSSSMGIGDHGTLATTDDVTGDSAVDLLIGTRSTGYGYVWVLDGATGAAANGSVATYAAATFSGDNYYYPIYAVNGPWADEDGDGVTDFMIGGGFNSTTYTYGRSYLFEGGSSVTGSLSASTYDVRVSGDSDSSSDDVNMSCIADVDGDGIGDIIVGAAFDNYGDYRDAGSLSVFLDGNWSGSVDISDADDRIYGQTSYDYLGYSLTAADLDDDGYADFVAGAPNYDGASTSDGAVFIVNGNASGAWSTQIESAADGFVVGGSYGYALGTDTLAHPGDLDGDGKLDLAVSSEDDGYVWVFMDAGSIVDDTVASSADYVLTGTAGDFGSMLVTDSDLDNDGKDDLVIGADGDDVAGSNYGAVYVYLDASGWSSSMTATNASVTLWGPSANGYLGTGGAGGADLDGDGIEDLAIGASGNDDYVGDGGAVFIVPGW